MQPSLRAVNQHMIHIAFLIKYKGILRNNEVVGNKHISRSDEVRPTFLENCRRK